MFDDPSGLLLLLSSAEYLAGGSAHSWDAGDFPGMEMRGGELIVEGEATRPCANMKDGSCVILGTVHDMIPTFEKTERKMLSEWKISADVYKGYVANRGKGTLMIRNSGAK